MLFLDSFLQKPVATQGDLTRARGVYTIHRDAEGVIRATSKDEVDEDIVIAVEQRCLICLSEFVEMEEGRRLGSCGHFFHRECIDTVSLFVS
jgi:hypothetical protein